MTNKSLKTAIPNNNEAITWFGSLTPCKLMLVYIAIVYFLPAAVFFSTSIVVFSTPDSIAYKWYNGCISLLHIPIILYGLYAIKIDGNPAKYAGYFVLILLVKDVFNALLGFDSYIFISSSFEYYYQTLLVVCMSSIICKACMEFLSVEYLVKAFFALTSLGVLASILTANGFSGRFSAINTTAGDTGFFLSLTLVYAASMNWKDSWRAPMLIVSFILIIFTGSRINLILSIILVSVIVIYNVLIGSNHSKRGQNKKISHIGIVIILAISISITVLLTYYLTSGISLQAFERMIDSVTSFYATGSNYILNDESGQGRIASINTGLSLLSRVLPLGTNFSFYDMQFQMQQLGYPTFPHSLIISCGITMGIFVVVPVYNLIKGIKLLACKHNNLFWCLILLLVYIIVAGGAWSSFKSPLVQLMLILIPQIPGTLNKGN